MSIGAPLRIEPARVSARGASMLVGRLAAERPHNISRSKCQRPPIGRGSDVHQLHVQCCTMSGSRYAIAVLRRRDVWETRSEVLVTADHSRARRRLTPPAFNRSKNAEGRWRVFGYDELIARDKCSLDIFWLKDHSLEDSANLPDPDVLAAEIAEDLRSALEQIESVLAD